MIRRRSILVSLAIAGLVACAPSAGAQSYPAKSVKIIVPLAAGGLADMLARLLAQHMSETTKQNVVVENRTGGAGAIGADAAAKSPPDGYTLFLGLHAPKALLPYLNAKLPYHPAPDFLPLLPLPT